MISPFAPHSPMLRTNSSLQARTAEYATLTRQYVHNAISSTSLAPNYKNAL